VVHCAGVLDDALITALTPDQLNQVLETKAVGAANLHELTVGDDLAAFVVFSSVAGIFGNPGQGNYAAANAFVDAMMAQRQAAGLPGLSLAWGMWERGGDTALGMASRISDADQARAGRHGIGALSEEDSLALFDAALNAGPSLLLPIHFNVAALRTRPEDAPSLLSTLVSASRRPAAADGPASRQELAERIASLPPEQAEEELLALVRGQAAVVIGHSGSSAIEPGEPFKDLGFDSLTAVDLRNRLAAATGLRLPAALVFDHPTPLAVARWLFRQLARDDAAPVETALGQLESAVRSLPATQWSMVTARLRTVLSMLDDRQNGHSETAGEDDGTALAARVDAASPDEVLALIDREFGLPDPSR